MARLLPRTVRILAIETSTRQCSVALAHAGEVVQRSQPADDRVTERTLSMVSDLLACQSVELDRIDAFAFSSGPGAFTGLRTGCALVQGLAFACGRPVVAVGSLRALAFCAGREVGAAQPHCGAGLDAASGVRVMAATDARMGQLYWAVYDGPGAAREVSAPALAGPGQVAEIVARWGPHAVAGDALRVFASAWPEQMSALRLPHARADASAIAQLALVDLAQGRAVQPRDAAPDYVRDQVALTVEQRAALRGRVS
jgi:tRNA threonylcarbamoyladenosine biosynthesis protein TsaB